ncbi:MAG: GNAT family N-acetyltransferase [Actinomycetota bacterium]|nr:GNAT family N-acetyltransferase [Actinomycetota bacterium]
MSLDQRDWTKAPALEGERLVLEPLRVGHADEMAAVLDDPALHRFIGGEPATPVQLRTRYASQVAGRSADGTERWLNWVARTAASGTALGYVQATVTEQDAQLRADVAWVIAVPHQGHSYAREASTLMVDWLREQGVAVITAHVHPDHDASMSVARGLGLRPTDTVVDGEVRWQG